MFMLQVKIKLIMIMIIMIMIIIIFFNLGWFSVSFVSSLALIHELLGLGVKGNRPLTVIYGSEADGDLVLIQTFLPYYVNQVILMLN